MMEGLGYAKYESYKDSGLDWLGHIPEGWGLLRSKFVWRESEGRSILGNEELLSVSQHHGIVPRMADSRSEDLTGYKLVNKGELVTNIMLAWMGSLGISDHRGIVSPAYAVYELIGDANPHFLGYLYKTAQYLAEFARRSSGVVPSRWRMYTDDFDQVRTLLPTKQEQDIIVSFLADKCDKIDGAVKIKEDQIALLRERRQIIIQDAVTRGLNPAIPMKESGIDWIGQIPAHWEVSKLKFLSRKIVDGTHFTPTYVAEGVPFLRVTDLTNMIDGKINWDETRKIPRKEHIELSKRADAEFGDVLLSKNGTIGLTKVIDWMDEFSFFVSLCLIKLTKELSPHYFAAFFGSPLVDEQLSFGSLRTSVTNLHLEKIKELLIVVPPRDEQEELVAYIREISKPIDAGIALKNAQIAALKEYKTSLINAAVTGKIKVI